MRVKVLLAALFWAAPVQAGGPALPQDVRAAYVGLCSLPHGLSPQDLLAVTTVTTADIDGDGRPEYLLQTHRHDGAPGPDCEQAIFSQSAASGGYAAVGRLRCCQVQVDAARKQLRCTDGGHSQVALDARAGWPAGPRAPDAATAQARYTEALGLLRGKRYADAERAACALADSACVGDAGFHDLCAKAATLLRHDAVAEAHLRAAQTLAPTYAPPYATEGTLWQLRGDRDLAITAFQRYLSHAPQAADRPAIEAQIARLRAAPAPDPGAGSAAPPTATRPAAPPPAEQALAAARTFFQAWRARDAAALARSMGLPYTQAGDLIVPQAPADPCSLAARATDERGRLASARCLTQATTIAKNLPETWAHGDTLKVVAPAQVAAPLRPLRAAIAAAGPGHVLVEAHLGGDALFTLLVAVRAQGAAAVVDALWATFEPID